MLPATRQLVVVAALAIAVSLGVNACNSDNTSMGPDGPPRLTLLFGGGNTLPAASGDVALFADEGVPPTQVWVKVEDICLQGVGDGDPEGDQNGRLCLLDAPTGWLEIAEPSSEWQMLVDAIEVPAGAHQLRFIIMDVVIFVDGTESDDVYATSDAALEDLNAFLGNTWEKTGDAHCPSCTQTGLKVSFPGGDPDMQAGDYIFFAEFDIAESFGKLRGNSGRWVMHPQIRGSLSESVASISGTVSVDGSVALPGTPCGEMDVLAGDLLQYFKPMVSNGATREATPDPSTGAYEIGGLPAPATYSLDWVNSVPFGTSSLSFTATVTDPDGAPNDGSTELVRDQVATVNYLITEATCDT